MKSWKEQSNKPVFVVLYQGTGGRRGWDVEADFLFVMNTMISRGCQVGAHMTIINPLNGQDIHLPIAEQKQLARDRKGKLHIALSQFNELATKLGVPWHPMFTAFAQLRMDKSNKYVYPQVFKKTWEEVNGVHDANVSVQVS